MSALAPHRSRLRGADLFREARHSVFQSPVRSLLTAVGTALGTAAFVATLGLTSTISRQISDAFDAERATEVLVQAAEGVTDTSWTTPSALSRVARLNGVTEVGRQTVGSDLVVHRHTHIPSGEQTLQIIAADPGALGVIEPHIVSGRLYGDFHERAQVPVILLSRAAAVRLAIPRVGPAVVVSDRTFTVIGVFDEVARRSESLVGALIPFSWGPELLPESTSKVLIETQPGAASLIASQASLALRPEDPASLEVIAPPDPRLFRQTIESDVRRLTLLVSAVALLIGTVSIANSATAGIISRVPEIGLRRALGARPRHIFAQLLTETALLGGAGGTLGGLLGLFVVLALSFANEWTPVIDVSHALAASAIGSMAGLLAGLMPAFRATRIQPVDALQR